MIRRSVLESSTCIRIASTVHPGDSVAIVSTTTPIVAPSPPSSASSRHRGLRDDDDDDDDLPPPMSPATTGRVATTLPSSRRVGNVSNTTSLPFLWYQDR
jgi:hypothetical protein